MKLNTKTRYAARALLELALHEHAEYPVSTNEIAARQGLSVKYLEAMLGSLRSAGLVRSVRGAAGGYFLARPASSITMRDVYALFEGNTGFVDCSTDHLCEQDGSCATQIVWNTMYVRAMQYLASITVADLVEQNQRLKHNELMDNRDS